MKKNLKKKTWKERWAHKYRFSVLDEHTLEEAFHLRMSRTMFWILFFMVLLILFILFSLLYNYTPLKKLSPSYSDAMIRSELIQESMRLDSINKVVDLQRNQMNVIKAILAGDVEIDTLSDENNFRIIEKDFLEKTAREKEFCAEYEEKEKYNLSSIATTKQEEVSVFFKPVKGGIKKGFDLDQKHLGCDLIASVNEPVVSIHKGVVVFAEYTTTADYIIGIMHENNVLSIYKHNAQLLKTIGDEVQTGEVIAIVSMAEEDTENPYLHFELWKNGKPVNPADYISF